MSLRSTYLSQFLADLRSAGDGADPDSVAIARDLAADLHHAQAYEFDRGSAEVLAGLLKETKRDLDKLPWPRLPFDRMFLDFEVTAVKNVWIIFLLFVPGLGCR